mgnify:CR=1 FL=1
MIGSDSLFKITGFLVPTEDLHLTCFYSLGAIEFYAMGPNEPSRIPVHGLSLFAFSIIIELFPLR